MPYFRSLLKNESGSVAFLAALLIPLCLSMVGMAVDYGRAYGIKTKLQGIADSGVLAGAQEFIANATLSDGDKNALANEVTKNYVEAGISKIGAGINAIKYNVSSDAKQFTVLVITHPLAKSALL